MDDSRLADNTGSTHQPQKAKVMNALGLICLFVCQLNQACDVPGSLDLPARIKRAGTLGAKVELLASLDVRDVTTRQAIRRAQDDSDERVRIFAAMALSRLRDDHDYSAFWKVAVDDSAASVRMIARTDGLLRGGVMSRQDEKLLCHDANPLIRGAIAATRTSALELSPFLSDESGFVRAIAARRFGGVGVKDDATRRAIEVLLVDQDALVRGNAIVAALQLNFVPIPTIRGLIFDDRPLVYITEAFQLDEPASTALRQSYHICETSECKWTLHLMLTAGIKLLQPDLIFPRLLLPVKERPLIGAVAADALIGASDENVADHLDWAIQILGDTPLARQLRILRSNVTESARS